MKVLLPPVVQIQPFMCGVLPAATSYVCIVVIVGIFVPFAGHRVARESRQQAKTDVCMCGTLLMGRTSSSTMNIFLLLFTQLSGRPTAQKSPRQATTRMCGFGMHLLVRR